MSNSYKTNNTESGQSVLKKMRLFFLILCVVQYQVQASDWLNRTVRVDLTVNRNGRAYDSRYDSLEISEELLNGVPVTNGQYPWSIFTIAWSDIGQGGRQGQLCISTVISNNFFLTDLHCVGQHFAPIASSIDTIFGSVQLRALTPTNVARHYWYIEPSPESSPRIVLSRLHEILTFNPNIQPVRLPTSGNFSYEAWSSYQLRIGTVFDTNVITRLELTQSSILSNNLCPGIPHDHEVCATDGSEGFAGGSPGGAWIVYEYTAGFEFIPVVVGIQRFVNQTMSVASRVSHFVEWIETLQLENLSIG